MMKNKIIYLIVTIIIAFGFTSTVNAAQELTCIGTGNAEISRNPNAKDSCIMLKQLTDGTYEIYSATKINDSCENVEWNLENTTSTELKNALEKNKKEKNYFDDNGELKVCPTYISSVYDNGKKKYIFRDNDDSITADEVDRDSNSIIHDVIEFVPENENDVINGNASGMVGEREDFKGKTCQQISEMSSSKQWLTKLDSNYSGSCLYAHDYNGTCTIVQLDYSSTGVKATVYSSKYNGVADVLNGLSIEELGSSNMPIIGDDIKPTALESTSTPGECLEMVYITGGIVNYDDKQKKFEPFNINNNNSQGNPLFLINVRGNNFVTNEPLIDINLEDIKFAKLELTCEDLFGDNEELVNVIKSIFDFIKIFVPICLIVLSVLDFAKSVFAGNEEDMKKTTKKFIIRIIISVVIFLIPIVLKVLLGIAYDIWGILDPSFCGVLD